MNSWTTLRDPLSETSRAPSRLTTSWPCWNLNEKLGMCFLPIWGKVFSGRAVGKHGGGGGGRLHYRFWNAFGLYHSPFTAALCLNLQPFVRIIRFADLRFPLDDSVKHCSLGSPPTSFSGSPSSHQQSSAIARNPDRDVSNSSRMCLSAVWALCCSLK